MEFHYKHFASIDSTNTWAKQNIHLFDTNGVTLVTADEQTAGRGRFTRKWESPAGQNIYATFCFFIEKHRHDIGNIPQILAISAAKTLEELGFSPKLKWPNDILLEGKKVAGILCETTPLSDQLGIILGIGININMPLELLQMIDRPATSLLVEGEKKLPIADVLEKLKHHFALDLECFYDDGFHPFLKEYKRRMNVSAGDPIRFHDNRVVWEGKFHDINEDGSLALKMAAGDTKTFVAGEILF